MKLREILTSKVIVSVVDIPIAAVIALSGPALRVHARWRKYFPLSQKVADSYDVSIRSHHYYEPTFNPRDLKHPLDQERNLPGLDLNAEGQLAMLANFHFADELRAIPIEGSDPSKFAYDSGPFRSGDAETLYNFVRYLKPKRIVEIGSGSSTLMARLAIAANQRDDAAYQCEHVCIEPYEQPWLEATGAVIRRELVEDVDLSLFTSLEANDILFVDSSHVIRPQGDVLHEVLEIYPRLAPGVYVHVHDIMTPRDYLAEWVLRGERKIWNEQYLLEAFLSFNPEFEVIAAMNWLSHNYRNALRDACPILLEQSGREPGSFWFRRRYRE